MTNKNKRKQKKKKQQGQKPALTTTQKRDPSTLTLANVGPISDADFEESLKSLASMGLKKGVENCVVPAPHHTYSGLFRLPIEFMEKTLQEVTMLVSLVGVKEQSGAGTKPITDYELIDGTLERTLTRVFALQAARQIYATLKAPTTMFLADEVAVMKSAKFPVPGRIPFVLDGYGGFDEKGIYSQPRYAGLLVSHFLWVYLASDDQLDQGFGHGSWLGSKGWFINQQNIPLLISDATYLTDNWISALYRHPLTRWNGKSLLEVRVSLETDLEELDAFKRKGYRVDSEVGRILGLSKKLAHISDMTETEFKSFIDGYALVVSGTKSQMLARSAEVAKQITPILEKLVGPVYELVDGTKKRPARGTILQMKAEYPEECTAYLEEGLDI